MCYRDGNEMSKKHYVQPFGIDFRFFVTPALSDEDQSCLEDGVILYAHRSRLVEFFRDVRVRFYDGCDVNEDGTIFSNDNRFGNQMVVKVVFTTPIRAVGEREVDTLFQIMKSTTEFLVAIIQNQSDIGKMSRKYEATFKAFLFRERIII